jgi:hypothetical protein
MRPQIKKPLAKGLITAADSLNFKSKIKNAIVKFACHGFIPIALADWIIQAGGMNHG